MKTFEQLRNVIEEYEEVMYIPDDLELGVYDLLDEDDETVYGEIEILETYISESTNERTAYVFVTEDMAKKARVQAKKVAKKAVVQTKKAIGHIASAEKARDDRIDRAVGVTKRGESAGGFVKHIKRGIKRSVGAKGIFVKDVATLGMNKARRKERGLAKRDYNRRDKSTFKGSSKGLGHSLARRHASG